MRIENSNYQSDYKITRLDAVSALAVAHRNAATRSDKNSFAQTFLALSSATGSGTYVQEQKRVYAETGRFDVIGAELASRAGNRLNVEVTIPETPDDEPVVKERVFDGKIAHFSELMVYHAPVQPELREFPLSPKNPESIYNLPASEWPDMAWSAGHICRDIDTEGISPGEIYNAVKSVFGEYLGKDFLEPHYTKEAYGQEESYWGWSAAQVVYSEFGSVLASCGIGYDDQSVAMKEAAGYSGMSKDEIKAVVREKYPEIMTLRECMAMGWELYELGAISRNYANGLSSHLTLTINMASTKAEQNVKQIYDMLLDYPADFDQIVRNYDSFSANGVKHTIDQNKLDPVTRMLNWFKASGNNAYTANMLTDLWRMI